MTKFINPHLYRFETCPVNISVGVFAVACGFVGGIQIRHFGVVVKEVNTLLTSFV